MKTLVVNQQKCTGCRVCELACSFKHTGEFNPARARIQVVDYDKVNCLPVMCFQCERPWCLEVCPAGAIARDETTGAIGVSREKCVGCKMCVMACPFGNIFYSSEDEKAIKCELCHGAPECVEFCPTGALQFKEPELATIDKRVAVSERINQVYSGTM